MASGIVETSGSQSESESSGQQQTPSSSHSKLIQRLLTSSASLPQFIQDLLTTQAVVVAGTEAAGFLVERRDEAVALRNIAHIRPDQSTPEMRSAALTAFQELIKPCVAQGKHAAIEIQTGDTGADHQFCLVTLLRSGAEIVAVTAVITQCRDMERAQQRLVSMQLVAGYFDLYLLRRNSDQAQIVAQSHQHVLQLATAVATAEGFDSAAANLCNELATRTGASRVTLGWVKGHEVRVKALSHTEEFDKKQELVKLLESVMEECVDQEEIVLFDPESGGTQNVSRSAQSLSRSEGGNIVLSLPLRRRADVVGVVTLEFPSTHKISPDTMKGIAVAVDLLAPQLFDRYQNDRWLVTKAGLSIRDVTGKAIGPQHMLAKLITILVIVGGICIFRFKMMYHVNAQFQFESINKRDLQTPFDGYIKSVLVRPGDQVKKGDLLLQMDTSEFDRRLDAAQADVLKYQAQYVKDSADPTKQADAAIDLAQKKGAQAEVKLYQDRIDRSGIRAPFDGMILTGDLTDQVRAPKKEGDELFTIAADNSLRAKMSVSDRDIQNVMEGSHFQLATTDSPTMKYDGHVDRIVPQGEAKEGDNVFTVYGKIDKSDPLWRPGLTGDVAIDVTKKPIVWIWTHKFIEYVRLKLWM